MEQGHKLDSNPQHLEYMAAGWDTTTKPAAKLWQPVAATGGPVYWTQFWRVTNHHLEFDSVLSSIFGCQNAKEASGFWNLLTTVGWQIKSFSHS